MTEPFKFANGQIAYNINDLVQICQDFPQESLEYFNRGDFEGWLTYIGETPLADQALQIRQSDQTDEERLKQFLLFCQSKSIEPKKESTSPANTSAEKQTFVATDTPTNQVQSVERVERRFRLIFFPGGINKVGQTTMGQKEQIVSYQMLSRQIQLINRTGGKITDIQTI